MTPKATSDDKNMVSIAIYIAVRIYNYSLSSIMKLMWNVDREIGHQFLHRDGQGSHQYLDKLWML